MTMRIFILALILLGSCVPKKEFEKLQHQRQQCLAVRDSLRENNRHLRVRNKELNSRIDVLEDKNKRLASDSMARARRMLSYKKENERLEDKYASLKATQEKLLKGTNQETRELLREIQNTQEKLQQKEDRLQKLEEDLNAERNQLRNLRAQLENKQQRLVELERVLHQKDSLVERLKQKVSEALYGFKSEGLDVKIKNGKVYVSMDEKLLFPSGSTLIDQRGKQALKRLAGVLEKNRDINIMVEGHTDDVPVISSKAIKDNWDLSVKRATAVIRILMKHSDIEGERIIAAGRSKYLPIEPNSSEAARRRNRRTEIILTPKFDELLEILNM
jgi:chemotaxis protein MotB